MDRGWLKLWRKSLDSGMLKNPELWAFWSWCLLKASRKETKIMVGFQQVELKPGQFIFGREKAAKDLGTTVGKIRTSLDSLRKCQNITIKSTNKFSIITIVNWDIYQPTENQSDHQTDQQLTSKRPATDQQATTNKNRRSKELKNSTSQILRFDDGCIEMRLALYLRGHINKRSPNGKPIIPSQSR